MKTTEKKEGERSRYLLVLLLLLFLLLAVFILVCSSLLGLLIAIARLLGSFLRSLGLCRISVGLKDGWSELTAFLASFLALLSSLVSPATMLRSASPSMVTSPASATSLFLFFFLSFFSSFSSFTSSVAGWVGRRSPLRGTLSVAALYEPVTPLISNLGCCLPCWPLALTTLRTLWIPA